MHPLYDNEELVARVTQEHLDAGRTVLQLFQLDQDERKHSLRVLELLQLPMCAHVLSLGCGVGGMEKYWMMTRPDLTFELVNKSQAQLDLCLCPGRKVHADAQYYESENGPFDCTVMAYVLGHLRATSALEYARRNTLKRGVLAVLDVFDGSPEFNERMAYCSPTTDEMYDAHLMPATRSGQFVLAPVIAQTEPWIKSHCWPAIFTGHGSA